jgi:diguanylate cyclase (GGDEF)-like protein/PAS domain S-box-containing protein
MSTGPSPRSAPDAVAGGIEAIHPEEPLFRQLADSLPTGVVVLDRHGEVRFANRRIGRVLELAPTELTMDRLLAPFGADDRQLLRLAFDRTVGHGTDDELEIDARVGGLDLRLAISIVPVTGRDGTPHALVSVADVTRSAQLRDELRERATFDALTGCHNRSSAMAALDMALVDTSGSIGVLFIDLDGFKPVNDRLGHAVGDELLAAVARRLRDVCRASDTVGRFGGDEFIIVCRDLHRARDEAMTIAGRVHLALSHPFALADHTVGIGASIGVACSSMGMNADELLARADAAMYRAKRDGAGPVLDRDGSVEARPA